MNRIHYKRSLIVVIALFLPIASATTQIGNLGTVAVWTTKPISREHRLAEVTYVKTVRTAKQKEFDRVVFEFAERIPNYRIEYLKSHFYDGEVGRVRIKS